MLTSYDRANQPRYKFIMMLVRAKHRLRDVIPSLPPNVSRSLVYNAFQDSPRHGISGEVIVAILTVLGLSDKLRPFPPDAVDKDPAGHPQLEFIQAELNKLCALAEEHGLRVSYKVEKRVEDYVTEALARAERGEGNVL